MDEVLILSKKGELIKYFIRLIMRSRDGFSGKIAIDCLNYLFLHKRLSDYDFDQLELLSPTILMSIVDYEEAWGNVNKRKINKLLKLAKEKLKDRDFGDVDVTKDPKPRPIKKVEEETPVVDPKLEEQDQFVEKIKQRKKRRKRTKVK